MITMKTVRWEFNGAAFADALTEWVNAFGHEEVAAMLHVHPNTVRQWARGRFDPEFPHPHLSNLLTVCNELDLKPADFFTTGD